MSCHVMSCEFSGSLLWILPHYFVDVLHSSQAEARIHQVVLVDPVSILLSEPDVICNFFVRSQAPPPPKRSRYSKIGVVSNEIFNSELWLEDLPVKAKVLVCLSEQDQILPARKVQRKVEMWICWFGKEPGIPLHNTATDLASNAASYETTRAVDP
jgi:hypothetical protein